MNVNTTYTFTDADTNESYDIELTTEEYARAETDLVYATQVLEKAKSAKTTKLLQPDQFREEETEENSSEDKASFRWSDAATKCFLNLYQQYETALVSGKLTHNVMWEKISQKMQEHGFSNITNKQCSTKVDSLKRMYKNVKDHNARTGNNRQTWKYFEMMEEIFSKKPWVAPLSTISSIQDEKENLDHPGTSSETLSGPPKRRKLDAVLDQLIEQKCEIKQQKHHEDKMERLDTMNNLLASLVAANKK